MLQQPDVGFETAGRSAYADNWKIVADLFFPEFAAELPGCSVDGTRTRLPLRWSRSANRKNNLVSFAIRSG
jgi:hypothetical protein